jgi:hypothetical protein
MVLREIYDYRIKVAGPVLWAARRQVVIVFQNAGCDQGSPSHSIDQAKGFEKPPEPVFRNEVIQ